MPAKNRYQKRKDGRYMTLVDCGKKPDGSRNRIPVYGESSSDLEEKVSALKYEIKHNLYTTPDQMTVAEYAVKWFQTFKDKRGINTKAMYENVIEAHIKPSLGILKVKDITRTDCQRMINERWEHYETCNKIRLTMRQLQKAAKRDKIIIDDFWDGIEMPRKPASKKRTLTDLEREAIRKAEFEQSDRIFLLLLYGCGLRREEALALNVTDFDLKTRKVSIRRKIVFDKNNPVLEEAAKTRSGLRKIPIPLSVFPEILFYVRRLVGVEKRLEVLETVMLFTTQAGGLVTKSSYRKMWDRIIRAMNNSVKTVDNPAPIKGLTAHIFRHDYATMLYYSGISEIKAIELMGHADGSMIKQVYAHLDEEKENTQSRLDEARAL